MRTFDGLDLWVRVHGPGPAASPGRAGGDGRDGGPGGDDEARDGRVRSDRPDPAAEIPTVVLAHCWTADAQLWHYQVTELLSRYGHDIRILTWDHRGHGRSDRAPEAACTVANLARDAADLIDLHAPTGPLVLAGHSIGGMTLMALAEQRPDLVRRTVGALFVATSSGQLDTVTLGLPDLGPRARAAIPEMLARRARALSRRRRRSSPGIERSVVDRFLFGDPARPRDTGLVVDQLINCGPETMRGFYNDMQGHERAAALAAYDHVPCRVLVGTRDLLTPPHHSRRITAHLRQGVLELVPDAGHMLPLERPDLVSSHLVTMVDSALTTPTPAAHM